MLTVFFGNAQLRHERATPAPFGDVFMRTLFAIAALLVASPALAQAPATSLTLANSANVPAARVILDGATWSCEPSGDCTATGGRDQPAERACRRVVARMGAVSAFSWRGAALNADQLAACNAAAN
jgi:hypothetical protein